MVPATRMNFSVSLNAFPVVVVRAVAEAVAVAVVLAVVVKV